MTCRIETCCPPALTYRADQTPCENDDFICAQYSAVCQQETVLILKPSSAWTEILGEVRYEAFLRVNGVEQEIDGDVLYQSSDSSVALVGASSGNAIGISAGIITITANYGGLQAFAQLEVLPTDGCADRANHFLLLFDISKSSTAPFVGSYPSRLQSAQGFGKAFLEHVDFTKDNAAVASFDTSGTALPFSQNLALLDSEIDAVASTQNNTDLAAGLNLAANHFSTSGVTENRIIVLFTDGENNTGDDPLAAAELLRAAGIILIIVGLRASGGAFNLLQQMASAGFFINALPENATQVATLLAAMKSYLCSGNCEPPGNTTIGVGQLNYTGWINFDVTANEVDLIGKNDGGPALYDLLPGNGLYMDDHGSGSGFYGEIQSKTLFHFLFGNTYRLSIWLAGNQRQSSNRSTRVRVGSIIDNTVVRSYTDDFTVSSWDFTVPVGSNGKIIINGLNTGGEQSFGNLLDRVRLENLTTATVMLDDNFDNEHQVAIPPCPGYPYCYTECMDTPIPAQVPDPNPIDPLEGTAGSGSTAGSVIVCADESVQVYSRVIATVGDYGDVNNDTEKVAVADLIKSWNPDYICTNGDNWYDFSTSIDAWEKWAAAVYRDYIFPYSSVNGLVSTAVRSNFYPTIGNHDRDPVGHLLQLSLFNVPPVFVNGAWQASTGYYNVRRGLVEHFFYDSGFDNSQVNRQADGNDVGSVQWDWLRSAILNSDARWKIVHMHHPGYTSTATAALQPTFVGDGYLNYTACRNVTDQLKALGVDMIIHGHAHNYERLEVDGFPIIVNGAGGRQGVSFGTPRVWSKSRYVGYGAQKLIVSYRSLTSEFWSMGGSLQDSLILTK